MYLSVACVRVVGVICTIPVVHLISFARVILSSTIVLLFTLISLPEGLGFPLYHPRCNISLRVSCGLKWNVWKLLSFGSLSLFPLIRLTS